MKDYSGWTLTEIVVAIVIIVILSTVILSLLVFLPNRAKMAKVSEDLRLLESSIIQYKVLNGDYPTSLQDLVNTQMITELKTDPWDNPYQYTVPSQNTGHEFDLYSWGADGAAGGTGNNADIYRLKQPIVEAPTPIKDSATPND